MRGFARPGVRLAAPCDLMAPTFTTTIGEWPVDSVITASSGSGKGEEHDCWTTTEEALTQDLSEELRDAWERLRETAARFGDQRIYASHKSIMFTLFLLLLCAPEEELPRSLRLPWPLVESSASTTRRSKLENQVRARDSD